MSTPDMGDDDADPGAEARAVDVSTASDPAEDLDRLRVLAEAAADTEVEGKLARALLGAHGRASRRRDIEAAKQLLDELAWWAKRDDAPLPSRQCFAGALMNHYFLTLTDDGVKNTMELFDQWQSLRLPPTTAALFWDDLGFGFHLHYTLALQEHDVPRTRLFFEQLRHLHADDRVSDVLRVWSASTLSYHHMTTSDGPTRAALLEELRSLARLAPDSTEIAIHLAQTIARTIDDCPGAQCDWLLEELRSAVRRHPATTELQRSLASALRASITLGLPLNRQAALLIEAVRTLVVADVDDDGLLNSLSTCVQRVVARSIEDDLLDVQAHLLDNFIEEMRRLTARPTPRLALQEIFARALKYAHKAACATADGDAATRRIAELQSVAARAAESKEVRAHLADALVLESARVERRTSEQAVNGPEITRLKWSVQALASSADDQIRLFPDFVCIADELALDFESAMRTLVTSAVRFTSEQHERLGALDRQLQSMSGPDHAELWTDDALRSHVDWARIRRLAVEVIECMAWPRGAPPRDRAKYIGPGG